MITDPVGLCSCARADAPTSARKGVIPTMVANKPTGDNPRMPDEAPSSKNNTEITTHWQTAEAIDAENIPRFPTHCQAVLARGIIQTETDHIRFLYCRRYDTLIEQERVYGSDGDIETLTEYGTERHPHTGAARRQFAARVRDTQNTETLLSTVLGWFK